MAVAVVGSFFYLVIVFPIGMGFAGGRIAEAAARAGRTREKTRLLVLFLLTALVVYGAFHYGRYLVFQLGTWAGAGLFGRRPEHRREGRPGGGEGLCKLRA